MLCSFYTLAHGGVWTTPCSVLFTSEMRRPYQPKARVTGKVGLPFEQFHWLGCSAQDTHLRNTHNKMTRCSVANLHALEWFTYSSTVVVFGSICHEVCTLILPLRPFRFSRNVAGETTGYILKTLTVIIDDDHFSAAV